jgi:predicted nicotinamide N-methyase
MYIKVLLSFTAPVVSCAPPLSSPFLSAKDLLCPNHSLFGSVSALPPLQFLSSLLLSTIPSIPSSLVFYISAPCIPQECFHSLFPSCHALFPLPSFIFVNPTTVLVGGCSITLETTRVMGAPLWPAAVSLANRVVQRTVSNPPPALVLELGAGSGVPSLALALAGSSVVATDRDPAVLDLLTRHADLNGVSAMRVRSLDWSESGDIKALRGEFPSGFPLIVGSDILYHPGDLRPLLSAVKALLSPDPAARFILAMSAHYFAELAGPLVARAEEVGFTLGSHTNETVDPDGSNSSLLGAGPRAVVSFFEFVLE